MHIYHPLLIHLQGALQQLEIALDPETPANSCKDIEASGGSGDGSDEGDMETGGDEEIEEEEEEVKEEKEISKEKVNNVNRFCYLRFHIKSVLRNWSVLTLNAILFA